MEWFDGLNTILVGVSTFLGGGWIVTLFTLKPKKNAMEIENLKSVIEELQGVLKQRIEDSKTYREETTKTIDNLKEEIKELSTRVDIKHKAIYSAYQCKLKSADEECIVLSTFKKDCKECLAGKEQD